MGPTINERLVLCEWSHKNPDTVHHYNAKICINGTDIISNVILRSGSDKKSFNSTMSRGTLHLEVEAVGHCGDNATHTIDKNAFQCKC